jgi:hypothetical protein
MDKQRSMKQPVLDVACFLVNFDGHMFWVQNRFISSISFVWNTSKTEDSQSLKLQFISAIQVLFFNFLT